MKKWSLRRRFLFTSVGVGLAALLAAGIFLYVLFDRDFRARVHAETHNQLMQLVSGLEIGKSGRLLRTSPMPDPRFRQPGSGLYWQAEAANGDILRSRSLWDKSIDTGTGPWRDIEEPESIAGPFGEPVLVHARVIMLGDPPWRQNVRVITAVNESEISAPARHFALNLALSLFVLGLAMLVVSLVQLRTVMGPISGLRRSVRQISDGQARRVSGDYPVEIEPVVRKLNALLQQSEDTVERARARAGNFAHSLKTPLTVIDTLLPTLRERGDHEVAGEIGRQTAQLRKHADRELARARMAAGHGEPVGDVQAVLDEIITTMRHMPRGREIFFRCDVAPGQAIRMDREDFIEFIANVLDNARKWASSKVDIHLERAGGMTVLSVADDGPGIAAADMAAIVERGRRLDEQTEGAGIGLSIVMDIAQVYGLRVSFETAEGGGLLFKAVLPAA